MSKKDKKKPEEVKEEIVREPEQEAVEEISPEEKLQKEIEELKHEVEVTKNAYYKAYADMDNLKKRLLNEADQANKYRIQTFALSILPAIDSLERARMIRLSRVSSSPMTRSSMLCTVRV